MHKVVLCLIGVFLTGACAQTTVRRVNYNNLDKEGLRVYDPLPLLIITCNNVQLVSVPDFNRGYTVTFKSFLAKNNSSAKVTDGLITELSANLDDTGFLSLLQSWGEKALGVAKDLAQLGATVPGTIPGMEGIWRLNFDGTTGEFVNMTRIQSGTSCVEPERAAAGPAVEGKPPPTPGPKPPVRFP